MYVWEADITAMKIQEAFSRGKTQVAVLLVTTVSGVLSVIFYGTTVFLPLILVTILAATVFFIALLVWGKGVVGKIYERFTHLETRMNQAMKEARQDVLLPSSKAPHETVSASENASHIVEGSAPLSMYDLAALPPANVLQTHSSGVVGRAAARMELAAKSVNFSTIINSDHAAWECCIATIVSPDVEKICRELGSTFSLTPFQVGATLLPGCHFVVIEEQAFYSGAWNGCLETAKTGMFMELLTGVRASQQSGAQIILIQHNVVSALTNTLRNCADISINLDKPGDLLPHEAGLNIVKSLLSSKTGGTEHHV